MYPFCIGTISGRRGWVILRPLGNWSLPHSQPIGAPSSTRWTQTLFRTHVTRHIIV